MNVIIKKKVVEIEALVSSESVEGAYYLVEKDGDGDWTCTCPDHKKRGGICKHITAVNDEI